MKNLTLFLIFLAFISMTCSIRIGEQKIPIVEAKELILMPVEHAQEYLILSKKKYPEIKSWEITLNKLDSLNDEQPDFLQKIQLEAGKNYWKIPKQYRSKKELITLKISGLNQSGDPSLQTNSAFLYDGDKHPMLCPGCEIPVIHCSWECVGPNYAYKIAARKALSGNKYYLSLEDYFIHDPVTGYNTPFYYYVTSAAYSSLGSPITKNGFPVIGAFNASQHPQKYCSVSGNPIKSGFVYGIPKDLGPWEGHFLLTDWIHKLPPCVDGVNIAIMDFNNPANGANFTAGPVTLPNLLCGTTLCNHLPTPGGGNGVSPNPCDQISLLSGSSFYNDLSAALGCHFQKYNPESNSWEIGDWLEDTDLLELKRLDEADKGSKIEVEEFYDGKGKPKLVDNEIAQGLYLIGVYSKSGDYNYMIREVE